MDTGAAPRSADASFASYRHAPAHGFHPCLVRDVAGPGRLSPAAIGVDGGQHQHAPRIAGVPVDEAIVGSKCFKQRSGKLEADIGRCGRWSGCFGGGYPDACRFGNPPETVALWLDFDDTRPDIPEHGQLTTGVMTLVNQCVELVCRPGSQNHALLLSRQCNDRVTRGDESHRVRIGMR